MQRSIKTAIIACAALTGGCAKLPPEPPLHESIVCSEVITNAELRCDVGARREVFERWSHDAVHRPGSSLSVWALPADGLRPISVARVSVPARWGSSVGAAKVSWAAQARAALLSSDTLHATPIVVGDAPVAATAEMETVSVISAQGIEPSVAMAPLAHPGPLHAAIVCDRSNSTLGVSCNEAALSSLHAAWLARGGSAPGSSLALWIVGRTRDEAVRALDVRIPSSGAGERMATALLARQRLARALGPERSLPSGSAIAEAIDAALEDASEKQGEHVLYVSSDMRQATARTWNFERRVPQPTAFVAWLRTNSLFAHLPNTEVVVCGLHHQSGPDAGHFTGALAQRVRAVWEGALLTLGASGVSISSACDGVGAAPASAGANAVLATTR